MTDQTLYHFVLPVVEAVAAFLIGRFCLKRAHLSRSHVMWCLGVALCGGAVLSGLALVWLYAEYAGTYSFGKMIILFAPAVSAAVVAAGSLLIYAGLTLWGYRRPAFFGRFRATPGKPATVFSIAVLALAAVMAGHLILPALMLLPYTSLVAEGRANVAPEASVFTVYGHSYFTGDRDRIIVLDSHQWPEYTPVFRPTLDWRGRVVLDVRHSATEGRTEGSNTYYLPFEASRYVLNHGQPVRVNPHSAPRSEDSPADQQAKR
ncbi:MAG: hypothetical protein PVG91_02220 [Gammaproteobacteria bacterium]|jgi:hypothetical protein